jgi:quercetin dioxygenase-like cupin family protein
MAAGNAHLNTGDCVTVPPGIEHCFSADSDAVILVVFG